MILRDQLQQSLGRDFTVERELGGGGMSRVFLAGDTLLGRKIVVKLLSPEYTAGVDVERFKREIQLAAGLQHPHIVPLLSAGSMDGLPWYTMPFVEGESLRSRLERGSLSITESVGLLRDVAKALSYAHERGIVHRDIKPGNVLLSGGSAVVSDFGIAKAIHAARRDDDTPTLTQVGMAVGTPMYMAPEQAAGDNESDHRADLYSLGCLAYEVLAGSPPFAGRSPQQLLTAHMAETPRSILELRPETPPVLAQLVMRCLEKDASARPQHAGEIVRVLENVPGIVPVGVGTFRNAVLIYAVAFGAVAIVAKAAIVSIGLPDWVFPGAMIVMALGVPAILLTGYVQHVTGSAVASVPHFTDGTAALARSTMATIALRTSPHVSWRNTARGGMIGMVVFALIVAGFMLFRALGIGPEGSLLAAGALAPRDRIMFTEFSVSGTDSALGRVVSDAVRAGMAQSSVLALVTPGQIVAALRRMERPPTSYIDLNLARELGQREGVKAIVDGDVTLVGTSYFLAVRLVTVDSGIELMSYRKTATRPEAIIDAADELSRKLRARAGESLRAVNGSQHLSRVTTGSLAALRKYSEAVRVFNVEADYLKAARLLREAVEIDTLFAEAWRTLGMAAFNAGMHASRDSALSRAFALRHRLTEQAQGIVVGSYYIGPGRDREKAIQTYERMLSRGDSSTLVNLSILLSHRREFARAETLIRASERRSRSLLALENVWGSLRWQGRWAETDSVLEVARVRFPGNTRVRELILENLLDRGEWDVLRRGLDSARRLPDRRNPNGAALRAANLAFAEARLRDAEALLDEVFRIDSTAGIPANESHTGGHRVLVAAMASTETPLYQRVAAQLPHASELQAYESQLEKTPLSAMSDADVPYLAIASMFARAGSLPRARAALESYRREVVDTSVLRVQQPEFHATLGEIASAEGRWQEAVREMRLSDSRPDGPAGACVHCLPLKLFRVFVSAGMADSALVWYEAYRRTPWGSLQRNGRDINFAAPAFETVGKMYEQRADTIRAIEAYREFVERWKRADAEFQPRVAVARKRLDALGAGERQHR